jgi:hypothetical protein
MHHVWNSIHLYLPIHRRGIKFVAAFSHDMTSPAILSNNSIFLPSYGFFAFSSIHHNLSTTKHYGAFQGYQVKDQEVHP